MSDTQSKNLMTFVIVLLGVIQAGVVLIITNIYSDIDTLSDANANSMTYNTETYARRDDVKDMKQEVLDAIENLSKKIP